MKHLRPQPQPNVSDYEAIASRYHLTDRRGWGGRDDYGQNKTSHLSQDVLLLLRHLDVSAGLGYAYYMQLLGKVNIL